MKMFIVFLQINLPDYISLLLSALSISQLRDDVGNFFLLSGVSLIYSIALPRFLVVLEYGSCLPYEDAGIDQNEHHRWEFWAGESVTHAYAVYSGTIFEGCEDIFHQLANI